MSTAFATLDDLRSMYGTSYTEEQETRIATLLPMVSNLIRVAGTDAGVDIEARMDDDEAYASVVKMVTCDVVARVLRQSTDGEPMSQESQGALGYTWSGTYAIPGGGAAMSLMRNELKLLGLRRQRYGVMEIWDGSAVSQ